MLSRSVCDSAGRVTANTMGMVSKEQLASGESHAMKHQLARLESELAMLGQVIDFFKLYSVDQRP
jgi:hypothetical protein